MNLNMHILAEAFGKRCTCARIVTKNRDLDLSFVSLVFDGVEVHDDVVYVAASEQLRVCGNALSSMRHLIICGDVSESALNVTTGDVIVLPNDEVNPTVSQVQAVFRKFDAWKQELDSIVLHHGTVGEMLNASLTIFKSNILAHDRNLHIISYAYHVEHANIDPMLNNEDRETMGTAALLRFAETLQINLPGGDPFSIRGEHIWDSSWGFKSLAKNIFINQTCIARIVLTPLVAEDQPTPGDTAPFLTLCKYLKSLLTLNLNLSSPSADPTARALSQMLQGHSIDKIQIDDAFSTRGWDFRAGTYLFIVAVPCGQKVETENSNSRLVVLSNIAKESLREVAFFVHDNRGCIVVNRDIKHVPIGQVFGLLDGIAKSSGCLLGISREFRGLKHLKRGYQEAGIAVDYSSVKPSDSEGGICLIDDAALNLTTTCLSERIAPIYFAPSSLIRLISYDNKHRTNLYQTLRTYIEQNNSPTKSAAALYVSRSALNHRLDRIDSFLKLDLDDPQVQLHLRLSFLMLDTLSKEKFEAL